MLYTVFFCSAVHSIKSRVMEGTGSTVDAQSWIYCSVHVISRNSSQGFHKVFDYLHAWYIKEAAWKSFPGLVTSRGHIEVSFYF